MRLVIQGLKFGNAVELQTLASSGLVQRKCSGYFTQVMYADRTEAHERGFYETGLLVPPPSSSFCFSLYHRKWGTCHWLC